MEVIKITRQYYRDIQKEKTRSESLPGALEESE